MLTRIAAIAIAALFVTCASGQVVINQVQDGAAYTNDVAQGSVFVVKGTGLSGAGYVAADAPTYPTALNGVQITLTPSAGGAAIQALMVYTYNMSGVNQLAAVLPSTTTIGAYDVRVVNGGSASAAFRTSVVARKPGIVTASGSGAGPAQATLAGALILDRYANVGKIGNFDTRPARLSERVDLWGTGLGADRASDTGGSSGDQTAAGSVRVLVGGQEVTPLYAGRSQGFPGLDQIVFNLPAGITPDCNVPVQVRAGGVLGNVVTLAVAAGDICQSPLGDDVLRKLSAGQTVVNGAFAVSSTSFELPGITIGGITIGGTTSYAEAISGAFSAYTADAILTNTTLSFSSSGSCAVWKRTGDLTSLALGTFPTALDAGNTLAANKPDGGAISLTKASGSGNFYNATVSSGTSTSRTLVAGTYRLSGTGGADIGPFSAQVSVPAFDWSNRATITDVTRSQNLTVNWTGGGTGLVAVTGVAGRAVSGTGVTAVLDAAGFTCTAPASAQSLTVPSSILQQLPAVTLDPASLAGSNFSIGILSAFASSDGQNGKFTAPLVRGGSIDFGLFGYSLGNTKIVNYK